ncbi:hypothetical protein D3C72_2162290 [compost metagenome]
MRWPMQQGPARIPPRGALHFKPMFADFPAGLLAELDPLRQRQVARVVDGVGRAAHVIAPGVGTRFAAAARFFFATERAADLGAGRADVDVGNAAIGTGR